MPFADYSSLMLSNGSMIKLKSTFVSEGTLPAGSTWQMNPIPGYAHPRGQRLVALQDAGARLQVPGCRWFDMPDAYAEHPQNLGQGLCSGEWQTNLTTSDQLRVPAHLLLEPGEYRTCWASGGGLRELRPSPRSSGPGRRRCARATWQSCSDIFHSAVEETESLSLTLDRLCTGEDRPACTMISTDRVHVARAPCYSAATGAAAGAATLEL